MKLAVLSDVHGNVPALEAVLEDLAPWRPDRVIVNGDLVSRGPDSLTCMARLRERVPDAHVLRGNHEHFVLDCARQPQARDAADRALRGFAIWTAQQLGDALEQLRSWPDQLELTAAEHGVSLHITHGSRLGNRDGLKPEADDRSLRAKLAPGPDLFVGSHTHRPMVRELDACLVVNTGSVGQPFDGDARAAYARLTYHRGGWSAGIRRVPYDKQRAEQDFHDTGFLEASGPLARIIFLEHRHNRMLLGTWMGRYAQAVKAHQIAAADAVDAYLRELRLV